MTTKASPCCSVAGFDGCGSRQPIDRLEAVLDLGDRWIAAIELRMEFVHGTLAARQVRFTVAVCLIVVMQDWGSDMRIGALLSVAALSLWPTFAQATDATNFSLKTTEDLYLVCTTAPDDPLRPQAINFCEGFLFGAVSYHDAVTDREHLKRLICYPDTATRDDGIRAFIEWAASHQGDNKFMNDPPVFGAVRGLAHKWPCKQS